MAEVLNKTTGCVVDTIELQNKLKKVNLTEGAILSLARGHIPTKLSDLKLAASPAAYAKNLSPSVVTEIVKWLEKLFLDTSNLTEFAVERLHEYAKQRSQTLNDYHRRHIHVHVRPPDHLRRIFVGIQPLESVLSLMAQIDDRAVHTRVVIDWPVGLRLYELNPKGGWVVTNWENQLSATSVDDVEVELGSSATGWDGLHYIPVGRLDSNLVRSLACS